METGKSEKQELLDKLNELIKKQSQFQQEINDLEKRILEYHATSDIQEITPPQKHTIRNPIVEAQKNQHRAQPTRREEKMFAGTRQKIIFNRSGFRFYMNLRN